MAIDIAGFRARFPEFADPPHTDALVQIVLDDAELCVDEDYWGDFYEVGVYSLAAHERALSYQNALSAGMGLAPAAPSKSETSEKLSFAQAVQDVDLNDPNSYYLSTAYGRKYLDLLKKVRIPGFMVIADGI